MTLPFKLWCDWFPGTSPNRENAITIRLYRLPLIAEPYRFYAVGPPDHTDFVFREYLNLLFNWEGQVYNWVIRLWNTSFKK